MSPNDQFDAGVTALGQNDTPTAIAHLLVAHAAAPRDAEITSALEAARAASGSHVHAEPPLPVAANDLALALVLVNLALCVALVLRAKRGLLIAVTTAWGLMLGAWLTQRLTQPDYVVVSAAEARTYAANDAESLERYRLTRGDELVLLHAEDAWLKVRGPDGTAYLAASEAIQTKHLGEAPHR